MRLRTCGNELWEPLDKEVWRVLVALEEPLSCALDCLTRKLTLPLAVGVSLAQAELH